MATLSIGASSPRKDRGRLLWSLAVSSALNAILWVAVSGGLALPGIREEPRHAPVIVSSIVRLDRSAMRRSHVKRVPHPRHVTKARVHRHRHHAKADASSDQDAAVMAPPQPASLALPHGWAKQDFGFLAVTDTTTWLDWKHQGSRWVPRVFLWDKKVEPGYMHRTTLGDAVKDIVDTLHSQDAKIYASRAQQVCRGQRPGWFLSYAKLDEDPPLHFDETLYMDGTTIYRATYIRAADQPEDSQTRDALNTLCYP